jgi:hypothetical protein
MWNKLPLLLLLLLPLSFNHTASAKRSKMLHIL